MPFSSRLYFLTQIYQEKKQEKNHISSSNNDQSPNNEICDTIKYLCDCTKINYSSLQKYICKDVTNVDK